ncbi:DUF433 domain-containing protein [Catellatospora sp. NPDC049111]|uniref:DUF433 domain-containing protein n=1 Tax=Catellatospora sp. NPDC049111 TaxID=3155271 RepID=UPI0033CBA492
MITATLDRHLTTAIYSFAEGARMLGMPPATLHNWATGYLLKRADAPPAVAYPLVTSSAKRPGSRAVLPFVGLAEAYALLAFREAGVPVLRIRPAVKWLDEHLGLPQALASERLMTDGAEVLYDFAHHGDDDDAREAIEGLVVIRSGQQVFRPVVEQFLKRVTYRNGWISAIRLPGYEADVIADPLLNGGQPTLRRRGVRVADVLGRVRAGECPADVADDYGLDPADVVSLAGAG